MDKKISDIFDYGDEIAVTERDELFDPARIKELTMNKINGISHEDVKKTVKKARPVYRTLLIAAAVAVLLIGTALAAYQIALKDTLTGESYTREIEVWNGSAAASGEPEFVEVERLEISINGLVTSPEYQAYAEWTAWNDAWLAANPDPWAARGVDDSYFETPENYAFYYDAYFPEQAEKLDEIIEKYGLTLHTVRAFFETEEELCAVLGVDGIWRGEHDTVEGYVYDDGTFKLVSRLGGEPVAEATVWLAADGSFTMIRDAISSDYEEWSYTTADGVTVALVLENAADYPQTLETLKTARIIARLDEALVSVSLSAGTREALQACADRLELAALGEVFSAKTDRSYLPAAAAAQAAAWQKAQEEWAEAQARHAAEIQAYENLHTESEWAELVKAELGDYSLPYALEGQYLANTVASHLPKRWGITRYYSDDSYVGMERSTVTYEFRYERDWSDETHETSTTREEFEALEQLMREDGVEFELVDIGGQEVYVLTWAEGRHGLIWYDAERDLFFSLTDDHASYDPRYFTREQLLGLVESFYGNTSTD